MCRIIACAVLFATALASSRAFAEMIVLRDGKVVVGLIAAEEPQQIRLKTGGPAGPTELILSRPEIQALYRGLDESKQIEQSGDAAQLAVWAEQYFHAGLESPAVTCLNRAVKINPEMGEKPRTTSGLADESATKFSTFWNRTLVRANAAALAKRDAEGHLRLASWAREGGLKDESLFHLRRAWSIRPDLAEARALAEAWKVRLEGAFRIDLSPALDESLFNSAVQDENQWVEAGAEKQFLTIPIRYESAAGPCTLSKGTFRGKDARGFYGLRNLVIADGQLRLQGTGQDAVYERFDISLVESKGMSGRTTTRLDLLGRNSTPPRQADLTKPPAVRSRPRSETLPATTWVALILEIPKDLDELTLDWADGREEVIDLSFLRRAGDLSAIQPGTGSTTSQPARTAQAGLSAELRIPIVDRALGQVRTGHGSTAALAVVGLTRARDRLFGQGVVGDVTESVAAWCSVVDVTLLGAAANADSRVRQAIWNYLIGRRGAQNAIELPAAVLETLTAMPAQGQLAWVEIVSCGVSVGPCGPWWSRNDARMGKAEIEASRSVACVNAASRMLGAILKSHNREACGRALDVFLRLDSSLVNWDELVEASPEAQIEALIRVDTLEDRVLARQVLRRLIARLRPKAAKRMAQQAQSLGVRLGISDRSILEQWYSLDSSTEQISLLTALSGFDLGDLVYTTEFSDVIADATSEGEEESVREAGLQLMLRQAERECRRAGPSFTAACFPVLVSRASFNPMLRALRVAAQGGGTETGSSALRLMIRKGFSEEAIRAISGSPSSSTPPAIVDALISSPESAQSDSFIALLGRLLTPDNKGAARRILDHLSTVASQTPVDERWRLYAALKAGVDIVAMDELATRLAAPTSDAALVWLHSICHMSAQDRQRLASLVTPEERVERLTEINLRRGRLVDGDYAGLVILETMQPRVERVTITGASEERVFWQSPVFQTIVAPTLTLRAVEPGDPLLAPPSSEPSDELREDLYRVFWKDKQIGMGYIVVPPQPIRKPDSYCPSLVSGGEKWFESKAAVIDESAEAVGPLQLPSRRVAVSPASGTMTLDVSEWLRAALSGAKYAPEKALDQFVPSPYPITLRYGAFGSYYGTAVRRATPDVMPPDGMGHLCNIMIVLERLDASPGEASGD